MQSFFVILLVVYGIIFVVGIIKGYKTRNKLLGIATTVLTIMAASGVFKNEASEPGTAVHDLLFGKSIVKADTGNYTYNTDYSNGSTSTDVRAELVEWNTVKLQENYNKVIPYSCEASSYIVMEDGYSFPGNNVIDGDKNTSWQDGLENHDAIGENLTFLFDAEYDIEYIVIRNGNAMADENYYNNSRIRRLRIVDISSGDLAEVELEDVNEWQQIAISGFGKTAMLAFVVESEYEGAVYQDTCVSEVEFYCR